MTDRCDAKRILITGCSSGFGAIMVDKFLAAGWQVKATTRNQESQPNPNTDNLEYLQQNVATEAGRKAVVQRIASDWPEGLSCIVNNAGYGLAGPLESLSDEQIRQQFEVNFFAPVFLVRDLLPLLRKVSGRVINISSVLGIVGMPMQSMYAASKFALEGFSESLYYELSQHGIQVCLVEPGGFRTKFADNLDWASCERLVDASVYQKQLSGYRNALTTMLAKPAKNPAEVASVVFALASRQKMPLRVRVGNDSQLLYYLRRLLPQKIADRVLCGVSRKILETKAP